MSDAQTLRAAATIIRRRSKRPRGFWLAIFCRVLTETADDIDKENTIDG